MIIVPAIVRCLVRRHDSPGVLRTGGASESRFVAGREVEAAGRLEGVLIRARL